MAAPSSEREVSLSTGRGCAQALRGEGAYEVVEVDCGPDLPALAGRAGNPMSVSTRCMAAGARMAASRACWNGCVSPTTHSGVLASALAMDKTRTKEVYRAPLTCRSPKA